MRENMTLLSIINEVSRTLLNSSDTELSLERSLELLAKGLDVDHLRIDRNAFNEDTDKVYVESFYEWFSNKSIAPIEKNILSSFSYDEIFGIFSTTIGVGKPFISNNMDNIETISKMGKSLKNNGLKSFFVAPIFFNANHWGNISFLDYRGERDWCSLENELMILASIFGGYFKNMELRNSFGKELSTSHSAKMATLGEMASGIAHEINNPLFVINGYASRIETSIDRGNLDEDELRNISMMIQKNCKRVSSIVSGLRLISRKSKLDELEVRSLKDVVDSAIDISKERIRLAGIDLICDVRGSEEILIECLPEQISQVIVNLLNNSHDSLIEKSGERWIKFVIRELEDRVILSLTDSGERVSSNISNKMMQPFFTTKKSGKGTGLGLSISKEIISKHGGKFYFDENSEKMTFVIELPKLTCE